MLLRAGIRQEDCIMPALFVVAALAELISGNSGPVDVDMVEIIAGIVTMGIFVLMGIKFQSVRRLSGNSQNLSCLWCGSSAGCFVLS